MCAFKMCTSLPFITLISVVYEPCISLTIASVLLSTDSLATDSLVYMSCKLLMYDLLLSCVEVIELSPASQAVVATVHLGSPSARLPSWPPSSRLASWPPSSRLASWSPSSRLASWPPSSRLPPWPPSSRQSFTTPNLSSPPSVTIRCSSEPMFCFTIKGTVLRLHDSNSIWFDVELAETVHVSMLNRLRQFGLNL